MRERHYRWLAFIFCSICFVVRAWSRLIDPQLWAEDGRYFFQDALNLGIQSLVTPVAGYYHSVQRMAAWVFVSVFPISIFPLLVVLFSLLFFAWVISTLTRESWYSEFLPKRRSRFLLILVLCLAPGLNENLGTLCALHWALSLQVLFISLRSLSASAGIPTQLWLLICGLSGGEAVTFIPVFLLRIFFHITSPQPRKDRAQSEVVSILMIFVSTILCFRLQTSHELASFSFKTLEAGWATYITHLICLPTLGWRLTLNLYHLAPGLFWVLVAALHAVLITFLIRKRGNQRLSTQSQLFIAGAICLMANSILTMTVRPGSEYLFNLMGQYEGWWDFRHALFPSLGGILLWFVFFSKLSQKWLLSFCLWFLILSPAWRAAPYPGVAQWRDSVGALDTFMTSGCPKSLAFSVRPPGWYVRLHSKRPNPPCTQDSVALLPASAAK